MLDKLRHNLKTFLVHSVTAILHFIKLFNNNNNNNNNNACSICRRAHDGTLLTVTSTVCLLSIFEAATEFQIAWLHMGEADCWQNDDSLLMCEIQCCHCNIIKTESPATESETTHKRLQRQLLKSFMGMPSCRRSPRIAQLHASSSSCSCHIRKHTVTRDSLTSLVHIAKRIKPCMDRRQSTKRSETSPRVDRPGPEPGTRWFELYLTRAEWFAVNGEGYWRVILINLIVVKVNSVICLMNLHPSSPELCL